VSSQKGIYAPKRKVENILECNFYHSLDLKNGEIVNGSWDLRNNVHGYLGNVDFDRKRVLDVGTASGCLTWEIERLGGTSVGVDLAIEAEWDIVPSYDSEQDDKERQDRRKYLRRLHNGWWYAHAANKSRAKVFYGTVYTIPEELGTFDVGVFGSILLHLRDPFHALHRGLRLVRETAIVTDMLGDAPKGMGEPMVKFVPKPGIVGFAWWQLSPAAVVRMLNVLGFGQTKVTYHKAKCRDIERPLFTVVGTRTHGGPE